MNLVWIILLAPLAAALAILLFTQRRPAWSAGLSLAAILAAFGLSLFLFAELQAGRLESHAPVPLLLANAGDWPIQFGALLDRFSVLLLLVVTGVGAAIQVYSLGYMRGDPGFSRYYAGMSLFSFSMLGIVLASNFVQMFVFWELVGMSSWFLIGFWFQRESASQAAKKAFIVNRVGDFGFLLGILLIGVLAGTWDFAKLGETWGLLPQATPFLYSLTALLIFCGAVGKSAQLPLHVWLPDAMEGPTPVSALIHAATMVAAGVYMLCRSFFVFAVSPDALAVVAWVGGLTALFAALVAVAQNDIKRILAYSTLSQLGYMVLAVGLGGSAAALFHLTTHAFFKALLFLAAGSVIYALHHEQDIWRMGGLAKRLPLTATLFALGVLALAGIWPLSGFYSKDEILLLARHHDSPLLSLLFWPALFTAFLTAFYMGRLFLVAFTGAPRADQAAAHAHESPAVMLLPMACLGVLTVVAGWCGAIPHFLRPDETAAAHGLGTTITLLAAPLAGFAAAWAVYGRAQVAADPLGRLLGGGHAFLRGGLGIDSVYLWIVRFVQGGIAALCQFFDRWILQSLVVEGAAESGRLTGALVRRWQNGSLTRDAFTFAFVVVLLLTYLWLGDLAP